MSPLVALCGAAFFTGATPASAPVKPTALPPAALIAATNRVLIEPASTDTTISSVSAIGDAQAVHLPLGNPDLRQRRVNLAAAAMDDDHRTPLGGQLDHLADLGDAFRVFQQLAAELQHHGTLHSSPAF